MKITLLISKDGVMREVAVTTAYTAGKMVGDEKALDRISTVDEDENHLCRFWDESRADLCQELIGLVASEGMIVSSEQSDDSANVDTSENSPSLYEVKLDVSDSFDEALLPSMELSLFSFFVHSIAAKWYIYTNKDEAGAYADKASTILDDLHRKAVWKKRPVRPVYED